MKHKLIFIIGSGHSGSTLLDKAIGAGENIFSIGEVKYYNKIIGTANKSHCSCEERYIDCPFWSSIKKEVDPEELDTTIRLQSKGVNTNIKSMLHFVYTYLNKAKNSSHLESKVLNLKKLYLAILKESNSNTIIDSSKSITRALIINRLLKSEFDITFIHLVRNGKAVTSSYIRKEWSVTVKGEVIKGRKKQNDPKTIITNWRNANIVIMFLLTFVKRKIRIRYEDFCKTPIKVINDIYQIMGLKEIKNIDISNTEYHILGGHASRINAKSIEDRGDTWKNRFLADHENLFRSCKGHILNKYYGYE